MELAVRGHVAVKNGEAFVKLTPVLQHGGARPRAPPSPSARHGIALGDSSVKATDHKGHAHSSHGSCAEAVGLSHGHQSPALGRMMPISVYECFLPSPSEASPQKSHPEETALPQGQRRGPKQETALSQGPKQAPTEGPRGDPEENPAFEQPVSKGTFVVDIVTCVFFRVVSQIQEAEVYY